MRLLPALGAAIGTLALSSVHAQSYLEIDGLGAKAPPVARYTAAQRVEAADSRLQQGSTAARRLYGSDLHAPVPVVTATAAERRAAAQARWNEISALNKAGLLPLSSDLDYPPGASGVPRTTR
ncbi:hypothetical protein [Variovorax sp. OV329]|uniref:hypothetical protein n=1 Tax=Variovorax sp. OV329 TaxID=1882825 RepID=UPI0008F06B90|nr:hypothetical protein [Variovorax sp. OV329]SFM93602.1 hypothetical protein SAMN05444747_111121 [Variovorax sp. OV329]